MEVFFEFASEIFKEIARDDPVKGLLVIAVIGSWIIIYYQQKRIQLLHDEIRKNLNDLQKRMWKLVHASSDHDDG